MGGYYDTCGKPTLSQDECANSIKTRPKVNIEAGSPSSEPTALTASSPSHPCGMIFCSHKSNYTWCYCIIYKLDSCGLEPWNLWCEVGAKYEINLLFLLYLDVEDIMLLFSWCSFGKDWRKEVTWLYFTVNHYFKTHSLNKNLYVLQGDINKSLQIQRIVSELFHPLKSGMMINIILLRMKRKQRTPYYQPLKVPWRLIRTVLFWWSFMLNLEPKQML